MSFKEIEKFCLGKFEANSDLFKTTVKDNIEKNRKDRKTVVLKDKNGNVVVDCKYDVVTELNEYGFAGIFQENKWGVIDQNGKVVVVPSYEIETYYSPTFIGEYLLEEGETIYCTEISEDVPTFINGSASTNIN